MTTRTIKELQQALAKLGYDPGEADGKMGPRTLAALVNFQADHKLRASGEFDAATITALDLALVIKEQQNLLKEKLPEPPKPAVKSLGVVGGVVAAIVAFGGAIGYTVTAEQQAALIVVIPMILAGLGGIASAIGRWRATQPVSGIVTPKE